MSKKHQQKVTRVIYLILITVLSLILASPFAIPIIFAASVALALFPLLLKLEAHGWGRKKAAALLTSFFAIVISIPVFFFIVQGTLAVTGHLEKINFREELRDQGVSGVMTDLRHDVVMSVHKFASKFEFANFLTPKKIDAYLNTVTTFLLNFFQGFASSIPTVVLFLLVMIVCIYSFLKNAQSVRNFFQEVFGFKDEKMDQLVSIFISDSRQVYISNVGTGAIQSLIVATAAAILGIGSFFLIFFITLILSFIPVIGAAPVAFACGILAYITGNTTAAIIMGVVGLFSGTVDNFLRPWLATFGESRIPPISAFICVLGGALLLGFPGLFIGILIGSLAYDTLPLFWEEISKNND